MYFAADADSVYEEAYNTISEKYPPIRWGQDGLIISYPPYEMGPFSSGYIEFTLDYKELGMEIK